MRLNTFSATLGAIFLLLFLGVLLSLSQPGYGWGRYEWDVVQPFEGRLHLEPYPLLEIARVLESDDFGPVSIYPLSNSGRGFFTRNLQEFEGKVVSLNARILCSGELTMLEVQESTIEEVTRVVEFPEPTSMKPQGEVVLRGEITDMKSYLGFREPGFGDVLRSPSSSSIRAGIPPVLVVTDKEGRQKAVVLIDEKKRSMGDSVLNTIAVPVEIRGTLCTWGGVPFLAANASSYRKLSFWE